MMMKSDRSVEVRPRCRSSSGRTGGSFGTMTPGSYREHRPRLESDSSDPSRPLRMQRTKHKDRGE